MNRKVVFTLKGVHGYGIICRHHAICYSLVVFTGLSQSDTVKHVSLVDLFRFALKICYRVDALPERDVYHFCNPCINKETEVKDQDLAPLSFAQYSSSRQIVRYRLVTKAERPMRDM